MGDIFYLGQIIPFSGNFELYGTLFCDGSSVSILEYQALYSIIGTNFGGDGDRTFKLPKIESVNGIHYLIVVGPGQYPERTY